MGGAAAVLLLPVTGAAQTRAAPVVVAPAADDPRPTPGPVYEIPDFSHAVERGTRTRTGRPGDAYWVQHPRYSIDARLDPASHTISGRENAVYRNASPDTLRRLAVHLRQNAFAPGAPRRTPAPVTGGVHLGSVRIDGRTVPSLSGAEVQAVPITDADRSRTPSSEGYAVDGTILWIALARPLAPGDSAVLDVDWSYTPPPSPADGREGREGDVYFAGYWYPQFAVYDDVHGWVADPYQLQAEFYMDPADYDVRVTAPRGWVVGATGRLVNASEVLSAQSRDRLARARRTGEVVRVLTPGDGAASAFAGAGPTSTWHFTADGVRDFAWGASNEWAWDATRALVGGSGDVAPDTVDIHSFFRLHAAASAWAAGGARFTRNAIERLSDYLWTYPWQTMTSMEGVLDSGGMEYPMMTLMQPWADTLSLAGDLMHETGHMWFPMQVGSNEKRYPWMDEGFTQFDVAQGMRELYGEPRAGGRPNDSEPGQRALYLATARAGQDERLMWPGELYPPSLYFIMYYDKTAQVMAALRGVLGEETFHRALREYGRRWIGRHPYPYDFFNTVADVSGKDLSWFWTTWFYEPWSLDQAVADVRTEGDSTTIVVEDRGLAPMPVRLAVSRADGSVQRLEIPVQAWLGGARRVEARVAARPAISRVEIDPEALFPDVDRSNQLWAAGH